MSISIDDLSYRCKTKEQLHRACIQEGWWMPPNKSALSSLKFLKDVVRGKCYCPKLGHIKFKPCIYPPSIDYLVSIYEGYVNGREWDSPAEFKPYDRLLSYLKHYSSDKAWLVGLLSLLTPNHAIFKPDYRPPV